MRKFSPWTLLRRRLDPICEELHAAAPWRVEGHPTVEGWLLGLSWWELVECDTFCRWQLCSEPPTLRGVLADLTAAATEACDTETIQERLTVQVMHRMLFAMDLALRMRAGFRREFPLTGNYSEDATLVLIHAWRTGAALEWAREFGPEYR
jgi:hypothetical protein